MAHGEFVSFAFHCSGLRSVTANRGTSCNYSPFRSKLMWPVLDEVVTMPLQADRYPMRNAMRTHAS